MAERYIVTHLRWGGDEDPQDTFYVNDTDVWEDEPYEVVCETGDKSYALLICVLLNRGDYLEWPWVDPKIGAKKHD